jgi:hypothetical protein
MISWINSLSYTRFDKQGQKESLVLSVALKRYFSSDKLYKRGAVN